MSTLLPIAASLKHLSLGGNRRLGGCFIPVDMLVQFQRLTFLGLSALNLIGPPLRDTLTRLLVLAPTLKHLSLSSNKHVGGCEFPADLLLQFPRLSFLGLSHMNLTGPSLPKVFEKLLPMAPMLKQIAISGNTCMGGKCEIPLATITEFTELTFLGIAAMDLSDPNRAKADIERILPNCRVYV